MHPRFIEEIGSFVRHSDEWPKQQRLNPHNHADTCHSRHASCVVRIVVANWCVRSCFECMLCRPTTRRALVVTYLYFTDGVDDLLSTVACLHCSYMRCPSTASRSDLSQIDMYIAFT